MNLKKLFMWQVSMPILVMFMIAPWSTTLDKTTAQFFYENHHFSSNRFLDFIYYYGFFPAWVVAGVASTLLLLTFFSFRLRRWRRPACFLLATLALGPGLLVHATFKDHWGRPRPKQVVEYGGKQIFRAFYQPNLKNQPEPSKSFPCGHASMGFYFFTFALLGKHFRKRKIYYGGMLIAIVLGGLLSFARMAQGGHFLSDTLASALILWLTTVFNYYLFFKSNSSFIRH